MSYDKKILDDTKKLFAKILSQHGPTPQGVGWKDDDAQLIRFEQILKVVDNKNGFIINELGCGYGRLFEYMRGQAYRDFRYIGYDISPEMIDEAKKLCENENCEVLVIEDPNEMKQADYSVSSGIFNLKMSYPDKEWYKYIIATLDAMNAVSKKGFSFNILTKYSDKHLMRDELYYADPCKIFDYCKRKYSRNVALLHDYELYEFTILVRKG